MKKIKLLYKQIVFTLLAFTVMVVLSYTFNSRTVKENLSDNADSVLSFTWQKIESELASSRMMLGGFSQAARQILFEENTAKLQHYINILSDYLLSGESGLKNINGVYGYFYSDEGGGVFLYSDKINWASIS